MSRKTVKVVIMRRATVYDVAEKAGVSTATVSFTYRRPDKVKPETRARVLRAAKALDYVPSASARGLARGRTGALGLYSFDMIIEQPLGDEDEACAQSLATEHPVGQAFSSLRETEDDGPSVLAYPLYVDEVQRGFELECWHRGRSLLLGTATARNDTAGITDVAGRVDGLAVFPNKFTDTLPLESLCRSIPIVRLSESGLTDPAAYISCDNFAGMGQVVDHLADVHGVRDMAFIGSVDNYDARQRFEALRSWLDVRGLAVPACPLDDSVATSRGRFVALCETIDAGQLPQALVCANDQTAFEVIEMLHYAGLSVPRDVIVTGFDGVLAARVLSPTLTTVRQPMEEMGRLAARLLDERAGKPWEEPTYYQLPVRFVARESCGCK